MSIERTGRVIDLDGLIDPTCKKIPGLPHSEVLIRFIDGFMVGDSRELELARAALVHEMGAAAMVDAVGVASNFQRMVRIADSTAIPPVNMGMDELAEELNAQIGLNDFASASNSKAR